MSFGENLTNLRRQKGWSQDDLANNLDLSRQAISKWENDTSKPDVDNLQKISKIFSVKIDELLNNEIPDDKAVTLDVKKEEKREKTITIIKLMIIAVIILYVISVIYKFASLLVIVNGVQKYANLNNYHYVITTYENSFALTRKEVKLKDRVLDVSVITFKDDNSSTVNTCLDYNSQKGTITDLDNDFQQDINLDFYLNSNKSYEYGMQIYYEYPIEMRSKNYLTLFIQTLDSNKCNITIEENVICVKFGNNYMYLDKQDLLPIFFYSVNKNDGKNILQTYQIEL